MVSKNLTPSPNLLKTPLCISSTRTSCSFIPTEVLLCIYHSSNNAIVLLLDLIM
ncbi:hypothetical protein HanPSC8_Chr07g0304021 [Helianthus annuus]|nr:hypothetical protein HanPSC8_Chr07g0304021 [Helianthus annuus]